MSRISTDKGPEKGARTTNPPAQRLYDLKSAAEYLGRPVWGVRELIWAGKLPVVRSGRKMYLDIEDINQFIDREKITMI